MIIPGKDSDPTQTAIELGGASAAGELSLWTTFEHLKVMARKAFVVL